MQLTDADVKVLLDAAPDAMVIIKPSGRIVFVNQRAETLFGYRRQDLIDQPIEKLLPERLRDSHIAHRDEYCKAPVARAMSIGIGMDIFGLRKDGAEFPIEVSLGSIATESCWLLSSIIRDISEPIATRNALRADRDEAERANRAKSSFLATASHNLRQPLQTLNLLNAVLKKTINDPYLAQAVERQADALGAMTNLLNALLDISKLESGAIEPDIADCRVQEIFRRLRSEFELQADAKGLRLRVDDCEDIVRTDAGLLEQIIQNLIANAIRYTKEGLVQLRCLHSTSSVRIEVLDTGVGIPVDELDAIFKEFYQLNREPGQRREGLGLGLSIVQRLARLLDHPLEVDSVPGEGTCFAVTLPRGQGHLASAYIAQHAAGPPSLSCRVLLIDDDPAVADASIMLLESEGHDVSVASTADEAIEIARTKGAPDVIVSAFHLGGEDTGFSAIERLRSEAGRMIPAVMVTAETRSAIVERIKALKACRILKKPVDANHLAVVIQELVAAG